jgi:hypothetical protein
MMSERKASVINRLRGQIMCASTQIGELTAENEALRDATVVVECSEHSRARVDELEATVTVCELEIYELEVRNAKLEAALRRALADMSHWGGLMSPIISNDQWALASDLAAIDKALGR